MELRSNIEREIAAVTAEMCDRVIENWVQRMPTCSRWPYERSRVPFINVLIVFQVDHKVLEISQMVCVLFKKKLSSIILCVTNPSSQKNK